MARAGAGAYLLRMTSRRQFLGSAGALALGSLAACQHEPVPAESSSSDLPPSIAALTSMKDQVRPITNDERQGRLDRARGMLAERGMSAMMLTGGTSLKYFTDIQWGLSERLFALILPAKGRPFVVCPAFERDRAEEQIGAGPLGAGGAEVLTWEEHESPYQRIAEGLRGLGAAAGTIGVEETVRYVFSDGTGAAMPAARLASATPITAGCRGVKSAQEIAVMRLAAKVTLAAYEAAYRALEDGMTQTRFGELVRLAHQRLGFSGGASVQTGEYSALPHGSVQPQVVRPGTILLIDGGCSGRWLSVGHQPDVRPRQGHRPDEAGLRDRTQGPDHRAPDCPTRP